MKTLLKNSDLLLRNFVCVVVLAVSLYAILHGSTDTDTKKWAFGTVGLILGRALASRPAPTVRRPSPGR